MPSLLLCDATCPTDSIDSELGLPEGLIRDTRGQPARWMQANTPYLLGHAPHWSDLNIGCSLEPQGTMLTSICLDYGGTTALALADLRQELQQLGREALTGTGAAAGVTHSRIDRFRRAVHDYQDAMLAYHRATHGAPLTAPARRAALDRVRHAGSTLNLEFAQELSAASRRLTPRFRALASGDPRVPDMIRHTRKVARLDVASQIEATRLIQLARNARRAGRLALIIDLGLRFHDVHEDMAAGKDWRRRMFVETGGFMGAAVTGLLAGRLAAGMVGLAVAGTRSGWVLILAGGAAATAITAASNFGDAAGQTIVGQWYDSIVEQQRAES